MRLLKASHDFFYDLKPLRLFILQGDWDKLEEAGHRLLSQKNPRQKSLELVAYGLQQSGRLGSMVIINTKASELFPNCWTFHFLAGIGLLGTDREKEARECFRRALSISPNDSQTLKHLINAVAKSDCIELAATEYEQHCSKLGIKVDIALAPISTVTNWAKKNGVPLLSAGEVEEIPFKSPNVWGKPQSTDTVFALSNTPYVADIKNARIFSNSSLVITPDGTALSDTAGHPDFGHIVSFAYEKLVLAQTPKQVLLEFSEFSLREIDEGIFLSGLASSAFGHWLPEFLPKLQFLQKHPDFRGMPIVVDANMPKSHFDHLRRFVNNPLILLKNKESLLCKRLLVAPAPTFLPVEIFPNNISADKLPGLSPKALRFLRKDESCTIESPNRRIFLARKNMKWRRLINEEEIARDLLTLGFETIFTETMDIAEQISLFQQAEWIVAPNGSSLLNLIFSNVNVKLIVLSQPNLHNWGTFQGPMEALGYKPLFVCGDYALRNSAKHSDYQVPPSRIRSALSSLGMTEAKTQVKFVAEK